MSEDILHRLRATNQNPDIQFASNVYNEALVLTEDICLAIANKAPVQLGMAAPNRSANELFDRDWQRETHFDVDELGPLNVSQNNCWILGMRKWQSMNPHNVSHCQHTSVKSQQPQTN
ncbi:hypothetical protein PR048_016408 [Dryococelus australis]|uniref:Uncharacterized protein n=1 Tax=Dryococelus australis TaxID=614101 RepID=A0ABQ9HJL7_9NEOP|nr:hypothetical protein PR048_016408 [Dryococelus australis]